MSKELLWEIKSPIARKKGAVMNEKHLIILEQFHRDCVYYWKSVLEDGERNSYIKALEDIKVLKHNPFVPCGEEIDEETKNYFVERCEMDLGLKYIKGIK